EWDYGKIGRPVVKFQVAKILKVSDDEVKKMSEEEDISVESASENFEEYSEAEADEDNNVEDMFEDGAEDHDEGTEGEEDLFGKKQNAEDYHDDEEFEIEARTESEFGGEAIGSSHSVSEFEESNSDSEADMTSSL